MAQKEAELVQQLLEKTGAKAIPWEPTAKLNQFVAPFRGNVTFTISRYDDSYGELKYRLVMKDQDGREMLSLDSGDNMPAPLAMNLEELYKAAHDTALKVEETIDVILDELRKVS